MRPKLKTRYVKKKLRRDQSQVRSKDDWIRNYQEVAKDETRRMALTGVFRLLMVVAVMTLSLLLFQGFHLWGFNLSEGTIMALQTLVISEVMGMGAIVVKFHFK
jgi:hypothetical protein